MEFRMQPAPSADRVTVTSIGQDRVGIRAGAATILADVSADIVTNLRHPDLTVPDRWTV
jgi:hypothetical protein